MVKTSLSCALVALVLAGCGGLQRGPEAVDGWLVSQVGKLGSPGYEVQREHHYPVASDVSLYLKGDDPQILEGFQSSLTPHFKTIRLLEESGLPASVSDEQLVETAVLPPKTAGFVLEVDKNTDARRLVIRVTDISTQRTFDSVRIDFSRAKSLASNPDTKTLSQPMTRALNSAAEILAGNS